MRCVRGRQSVYCHAQLGHANHHSYPRDHCHLLLACCRSLYLAVQSHQGKQLRMTHALHASSLEWWHLEQLFLPPLNSKKSQTFDWIKHDSNSELVIRNLLIAQHWSWRYEELYDACLLRSMVPSRAAIFLHDRLFPWLPLVCVMLLWPHGSLMYLSSCKWFKLWGVAPVCHNALWAFPITTIIIFLLSNPSQRKWRDREGSSDLRSSLLPGYQLTFKRWRIEFF